MKLKTSEPRQCNPETISATPPEPDSRSQVSSLASCVLRFVPCLLCIVFVAWVNPLADKTKAGNRSYNRELYDEAMTKYTEVLVDLPNSPHMHFNIGSAAYKKDDYEEAFKSYSRAASLASDPVLESKAYYNLGNCKYRQGKLKENTNLGEAISLYRESLDYYKQALDKNSEDNNAKYNHEFVERKIKELLDKMEQQQQQGSQQQEQQQQEQQQDQQEQGNQSEQKDSNEEQAQAAEAQQQENQEGAEGEQEEREGLSAEEARMLLDSLNDEELSQLQRKQGGRFPRVLKDW